jgi:hypothetical protein
MRGMSQPRHIFRWDLDKTYLRTDFDSFRGLLRAAMEKASEKRAVPGAPALLRALRAAGGADHRICIISGSPQQMRKVLEAKLALDGVAYDEFVLKPNLSNLLRGRLRALRAQVPYKLPALLASRAGCAAPAETLFGDDAESDALVYSIYADVVAGRIPEDELVRILLVGQAYSDQVAQARALLRRIAPADVVKRILIHLDRRSPTAQFERFGTRLVPIYNYFQAALVLYGDGQLGASDVLGVAREMLASGDYAISSLANSLQDLLRRGRLDREVAVRLALESQALVETDGAAWRDLPRDEIAWAFATRVRALGQLPPPEPDGPPGPARLDYAALLEEHS